MGGVQGLKTVSGQVEKSRWNLSNLLTRDMIHVSPLTRSDSCLSPSSHPRIGSLLAPQCPLPPSPSRSQLQALPFRGEKVPARPCAYVCVQWNSVAFH